VSFPEQPVAAPVAPPTESFALAQGLRDTRGAFERWRRDPGAVLRVWFGAAFAVAVALLSGVWLVSLSVTADPSPVYLVGITEPADAGEFGSILGRNLLVLALHATACVAGFIAGSSMAQVAETKTGFSKIVHQRAGPIAIGWVVLVTTGSLVTQALGLGFDAASIAYNLHISRGLLVLTVLPHALLELTAVFLPLAAWLIASRRREWADLLAATFLTVAMALPMLLIAATIEMTLWPRLLEWASPVI
jgi:hypothetical protein